MQCLDLQPVFLPKCSRFVQRGHPIQPPQHFQPYSVSMALQESCRSIHRGSQIRGPISALWNSIQFMTRIIIYSDDHAVTNSIWSCECEQKTNLIYVLEIVITLSELGHLAAACYFPLHQIFLLCFFFWKL